MATVVTSGAAVQDRTPADGSLIRSVSETVVTVERVLGLSDAELASALGVTIRTLERWRRNETAPQRDARRRLAELAALGDHARETFEDNAIPDWLRTESRYLGGLTPLEVIRAGRPDRVEAALEVIDSGIFL